MDEPIGLGISMTIVTMSVKRFAFIQVRDQVFWLKGSIWLNDFWLAPPEQRYWQNRETANI